MYVYNSNFINTRLDKTEYRQRHDANNLKRTYILHCQKFVKNLVECQIRRKEKGEKAKRRRQIDEIFEASKASDTIRRVEFVSSRSVSK